MYCKKCGKENPEESNFCQYCGIKFDEHSINNTDNSYEDKPSNEYVNTDTPPYPYSISILKLIILSLTTFGIYEVYWFYKQWKSFNAENNLGYGKFTLWINALFSPLSSYSLFKKISNNVKEVNQDSGLKAGVLTIAYFFFTGFWLGFLPLIPVQNKINLYWERKYSNRLVRSNFGTGNWILVIIVILIIGYGVFSEDTSTNITTTTPIATTTIEGYSQEEIASSVVNIFCPSTNSKIESSGGSGTIMSEDGLILTNSHIIPQDKNNIFVDEIGCLVILPNPVTGQAKESYLAHPIVLNDISDKYDLAFMSIYSAYYDEENKEYAGVYPRKFPTFDDTTRCKSKNPQLGESVRILGYPSISGGYSLTITDGIISSFPGYGLIVTSAKISNGNSGGLAIDKDGCMIGIPSMVNTDTHESLGVIISSELINSFYEEIEKINK